MSTELPMGLPLLPAKFRQPRCLRCNRKNPQRLVHGLCIYSSDKHVHQIRFKRGCWFRFGRWVAVHNGDHPDAADRERVYRNPQNFKPSTLWSVLLDAWLEAGTPEAKPQPPEILF